MRWAILLGLGALGAVAVLGARACRPATTVATFNIEMFPKQATDLRRVAEQFVEIDADLIAVQEIRNAAALRIVVAWASAATGRDYAVVMSQCSGRPDFASPGLVYDTDRLTLLAHEDFPELDPDGRGECRFDAMPGVLGVFEDGTGETIAALSVHHRAFPSNYAQRKTQLRNTLKILADVEARYGAHAIALGDFNTTGFRGEPEDERAGFMEAVEAAGVELLTGELACTEYYRPSNTRTYLPSQLDHVLVRDGAWADAEVLGMCQTLRCRPVDGPMPDEYTVVSDHCPVRVHGRW